MNSKTAISMLVALIIIAGIFIPMVSASTQDHIVIEKINDNATDGVDLGYYTPQDGKTSVEVYPDTVTVTADNGTVTIAYPSATKTITGDAILAIGGGSASSAKEFNLYAKNGKLYNSGVEYTSCTIKCVDDINQGSLYVDLVLTGAKTVYLMPLVDWAYLPTLGGAYGSYTGSLAYELSDVVSVGDFAGVYLASKGTDIISNNEYDLSATIERDADGNVTGVKYAKATAEAAAVDGSASVYTGEDPIILTPDDDDGTVAVLTPEDWDGEDAALSTAYQPTGTLVDGVYYTVSGATAIVEYVADRTATSVTIPTQVTINSVSYPVTNIREGNNNNSVFGGMTSLKTVILPSGLTSIGSYAFRGCTSLALTSLPEGVTSIGGSAFYGCTSLALTSLPEGVTSIGSYAFYECTSLALTSLPEGVTSIGGSAFYGCTSLALTSLPSGATIADGVFSECTSLALTSLPENWTSLPSAFYGCTSLALTSLPEGVTTIPSGTFANCTSLALTSLPAGLTSIRDSAFRGCTSLALTSLPAGLTSIGGSAFRGCTSLALTSLPAGLTSITQYAFTGCTMTNLIITSSPTVGAPALPSTLTEVLNLGGTTLTTAMGITDNTVVSDNIESLAIIQQKQYINSYYEQKDGAVYDLVGMIPIIVLAGLAIAIVGMYAARRD